MTVVTTVCQDCGADDPDVDTYATPSGRVAVCPACLDEVQTIVVDALGFFESGRVDRLVRAMLARRADR